MWTKRKQHADGVLLSVPEGAPVYWIGPSPEDGGDPRRPGRWYRQDEIFHVKGPCRPGALRGMGVLEAGLCAGGALSLAAMLNTQAAGVTSRRCADHAHQVV